MAGFELTPPTAEAILSPASEPIVLRNPTPTPALPTDDILNERATKYDFGLGAASPGKSELYSSALRGLEDQLRVSSALRQDIEDDGVRQELLRATFENHGNQISKSEEQVIRGLTSPDIKEIRNDPKTFFEKKYVERVMNTAVTLGEENAFGKALSEDEGAAYATIDVVQEKLTNKEIAQKLYEDAEATAKAQSWGGWGIDFAKSVLPTYLWYKLHNLAGQEDGSPLLAGDNLADTVARLHTLPNDEFSKQSRAIYESLLADNTPLARDFARALTGYSRTDQFLDNILISGVDIASVLPFGTLIKGVKTPVATAKGAAKGAKRATDASKALAVNMYDLAKAMAKPKTKASEVIEATGTIDDAAFQAVAKELADRANGITRDSSWDNLTAKVPSLYDVGKVTGDSGGHFTREFAERLRNELEFGSNSLLKNTILNAVRGGTIEGAALDGAKLDLMEKFNRVYTEMNGAIIDVDIVALEKGLGDSRVAVLSLGEVDGRLFETIGSARGAANAIYKLGAYEIKPKGSGFYIEIVKPLDETAKNTREALRVQTKNATPIGNKLAQWLTKFRTPDDTLPEYIVERMGAATYAQAGMRKFIEEYARTIPSIDSKDLTTFLTSQQTKPSRLKPDDIGDYSRSLAEFDLDFFKTIGRNPTNDEATAYFKMQQLNDIQFVAKNIGLLTDKLRVGLENFSIRGVNDLKIEGKIVTDWPSRSHEKGANVLVLDQGISIDNPYIFNTRFDKMSSLTATRKLVADEGLKIVQISSEGRRLMEGHPIFEEVMKGKHVDFIVVKDPLVSPLTWDQVGYQAGGRLMSPDGAQYLRQPNIRFGKRGEARYYGDRNIFQFSSEAEARLLTPKFEKARKLYNKIRKEADPIKKATLTTSLRGYVEANLPVTYKQFTKDFGKKGRLDPDVPFMSSAANQSLKEAHNLENVINDDLGLSGDKAYRLLDDADSDFNLYNNQVNLKYTGERSAVGFRIANVGSIENPVFKLKRAEYLDPVSAMERSLGGLVNSESLDTLRIQASERFLAEFEDLLEDGMRQLYRDPLQVLLRPDIFKKNLQGDDLIRLNAAKNFQERFARFTQLKTDDEKFYIQLATKMVDGISPYISEGFSKTLAEKLIIKNPADRLRSLAFDAKIGMFNPRHLFLQPMTAFHMAGILGPKLGAKASTSAAYATWLLRGGDDMLDEAATQMSKLGWKKEEFKEAYEALGRSGYNAVDTSNVLMADHLDPMIRTSKVGKIRDQGRMFFKAGEGYMRKASFFGAYLEWRQANPLAKLRDVDLIRMTKRADTLNVNMSHASKASWQEGWKAIPTQFWAYPVRMMEQMAGKRLTKQEKLRVIATNSAMFGAPVALSSAVGLWPVHETIREEMMEDNIDIDAGIIGKFINNGFLGAMHAFAFGEDTNYSEAYGPSGVQTIKDALTSDDTWFEIMGGASGSTFAGLVQDIYPIVPWTIDALNPHSNAIPIKISDFTDPFINNISSLSMAGKAYNAIALGKWYSKNGGQPLDDNNTAIAGSIHAFMGTTPRRIDDIYKMMGSQKDYQEYQKSYRLKAQDNLKKAWASESTEDREMYMKRVKVYNELGLFTPDQTNTYIKELLGQGTTKTVRQRLEDSWANRSPEAREFIEKRKERIEQ